MGLMLPGGLATFLQMIGYNWPKSDEEKLFKMGGNWLGFTGKMNSPIASTDGQATAVSTQHKGKGVQAFQGKWKESNNPLTNLLDGGTGGNIVGGGLMICGVIVIGLKIQVIIQLIQLAIQIAQAIATAAPTFGASLLEIPLFQTICRMIVSLIISLAMNAILGG